MGDALHERQGDGSEISSEKVIWLNDHVFFCRVLTDYEIYCYTANKRESAMSRISVDFYPNDRGAEHTANYINILIRLGCEKDFEVINPYVKTDFFSVTNVQQCIDLSNLGGWKLINTTDYNS